MTNQIKIADQCWIGTALLHKEHPSRGDFAIREIIERIAAQKLDVYVRPGVNVHLNLHCVANKDPNPGTYKMLWETGRGRRRLFREADTPKPGRRGKQYPDLQDIPSRFQPLVEELLAWYIDVYNRQDRADKALPGYGVPAMEEIATLEQRERFDRVFRALLADSVIARPLIDGASPAALARAAGDTWREEEPEVRRLVAWLREYFAARG